MSPLTALHALLDEARVASLAVAADDGPDVSLVPVLVRRSPLAVVLFVSELSPHVAALRARPACALLLRRELTADDPRDHHATERVTLHGEARFLTRDEARARGHDAAWSARFPRVAPMILGLNDFHFVEVTPSPRGARLVLGFGRAFHAHGPDLDTIEPVTGR
ncbi:MAG: pyridoxamine 5'-phosphate oxidase family protein [Polyangiales bacterium]